MPVYLFNPVSKGVKSKIPFILKGAVVINMIHPKVQVPALVSEVFKYKSSRISLTMEGGRVNGGDGDQQQHALSADMMYKLSKKIAQLTKVLSYRIFYNSFMSHMKR